jgi:hypothetical protein
MSRIRLYFDEDAMQQALFVALRARRIDVLTASECGMIGKSATRAGSPLADRTPAADMLSRLESLSTWGH